MNYTEEIEPPVIEKLYDLSELEEITDGDTEFIISLANIYLDTIPLNSRQMAEAAEAKDWLTVSKIAHKIKPTIDSMNIISISSDIRTLETDAKNKVNTGILGKIAVKVDTVINIVAQQLKYEYNI
jgi:hypothetical protein